MKRILTMVLLTLLAFWQFEVHAGGKTHWGYEGHEGPENWGTLSPDYHICKDGKKQSPIDIYGAKRVKLGKIKFNYKASPKNIVNNGHTIQINMNKGSTMTAVNGKIYKLLQFHFHAPSEHTIDGKAADMVAHLVHQAADGQLGVIGVLMNKGRSNHVIDQLWQSMPQSAKGKNKLSGNIKVNNLLPKNKSYYNYSGSLTTPPCSEGVYWMVLKSPIQVSAAQIKAFTTLFAKSTRPVQPMYGRLIKASQ